jgi:hypothetical protein
MAEDVSSAVPEWLFGRADGEGRPVDGRELEGRLRYAGIEKLELRGDEERPDAIVFQGPGLSGWVEVRWDETGTPVADAVAELVEFVTPFQELRRMHAAMQDMDQVAFAARALAPYQHQPGAVEGPKWGGELGTVAQVLETGIVTMYARSFIDGRARLGEKWWPRGDDRALHDWLIDQRHRVYAHANWTSERTIVDTDAMLGGDGPPIYAEARSTIRRDRLLAIAELCERQEAVFSARVLELKRGLGAAAPEPLGWNVSGPEP